MRKTTRMILRLCSITILASLLLLNSINMAQAGEKRLLKALSMSENGSMVALYSDGRIRAIGKWFYFDGSGSADIIDQGAAKTAESWENVVQVATTRNGIFAVQSDGSVLATRNNACDYDFSDWTGIVQIDASDGFMREYGGHVVGLKADGTVVAKGANYGGQCIVSNWTDIVQVAAGGGFTLGLKADGTVEYAGSHKRFRGVFDDWQDIVEIDAFQGMVVGLKKDGTVRAAYADTGSFEDKDHSRTMQWYGTVMGAWRDVISLSVGYPVILGIKSDGTVYGFYADMISMGDGGNNVHVKDACDVSDWTDIAAVVTGEMTVVGIKRDGTMLVKTADGDAESILALAPDGVSFEPRPDIAFKDKAKPDVQNDEKSFSFVGQWNGHVISYNGRSTFDDGTPIEEYEMDIIIDEDGSATITARAGDREVTEVYAWDYSAGGFTIWHDNKPAMPLYLSENGQLVNDKKEEIQFVFTKAGALQTMP